MNDKITYSLESLSDEYDVLLPHPSAVLSCLASICLEESDFKKERVFSDHKGSYNFWLNRTTRGEDSGVVFSKYSLKEIASPFRVKGKKILGIAKSINQRKKVFLNEIKDKEAILELSDDEKAGYNILFKAFESFRANGGSCLKNSGYDFLLSALIVSQNRTSKSYERTAIISNSDQIFHCWQKIMEAQPSIQNDLHFVSRNGFDEFQVRDLSESSILL